MYVQKFMRLSRAYTRGKCSTFCAKHKFACRIGKYDPNSLIYISKAMDLFDMGEGHLSLAHGTAQVLLLDGSPTFHGQPLRCQHLFIISMFSL